MTSVPSTRVLLCSDLDRTLLPNGPQPESPMARLLLRALAQRPEITLAYVSGRHRALVQNAIREYALPVPDYVVGDVGTTIYRVAGEDWQAWAEWEQEIAPDWRGQTRERLAELLAGIPALRPQEPEKQNTFKLSYYAPPDTDRDTLFTAVRTRLAPHRIRASLIWSIDEVENLGLFDVLPARATKLHGVQFLIRHGGFEEESTVFAGDSGNDLPVLASGLHAVLVRNAREDVREEAIRLSAAAGCRRCLYLARGDFLGMNGNYAAGVLEGLAHFIPQAVEWLTQAQARLAAEPVAD